MKDKIDYSLYAITDRYWHNDISIYDMVKDAILGGWNVPQKSGLSKYSLLPKI